MRHPVLSAVLLLSVLLSAPLALAEAKIAVIDVEYIILSSKKGKAAKGRLKKLYEKKQEELNKRQEALLETKKQLENRSELQRDQAFQKQVAEYQQSLLQLQEDFLKNQQELAKKEMELMKPILEELEKVLKGVAESGSYDIIINRGQQGVIWAKESFDITEDVLKKLDGGA